MSHIAGLIFDILTLAGLGVTIFYCARLSRQVAHMRADRKAFEALIAALNAASTRAETAIKAFRGMADGEGDALQDRLNKSRAMSDELEIMIAAGDSLADRLQTLAKKSAQNTPPAPASAPEKKKQTMEETASTADIKPRSRAEKELLEAVKAKQQS